MSNEARAICPGALEAQPDERLFELVREGQERAFEVLFRRYRGALLRYCTRFSLPEARAEDVLQQAFLNVWLSIRSGAKVRDVRPWLFRIVHNVALNAVRAERLRSGIGMAAQASLGAGLSAPQDGSAWTVSLDCARSLGAEDRMQAHEVLAGIADLPVTQREALLRTALGGESYEQVATALGVTDGAVRGLLQRARASLRAIVAGLAPSPFLAWALAGRGALLAATAGVAVTGGLVLHMEHPTAKPHTSTRQSDTQTIGGEHSAVGLFSSFGSLAPPASSIHRPLASDHRPIAFFPPLRTLPQDEPSRHSVASRRSSASAAVSATVGVPRTLPASDAIDPVGDATGQTSGPIGAASDAIGSVDRIANGTATQTGVAATAGGTITTARAIAEGAADSTTTAGTAASPATTALPSPSTPTPPLAPAITAATAATSPAATAVEATTAAVASGTSDESLLESP